MRVILLFFVVLAKKQMSMLLRLQQAANANAVFLSSATSAENPNASAMNENTVINNNQTRPHQSRLSHEEASSTSPSGSVCYDSSSNASSSSSSPTVSIMTTPSTTYNNTNAISKIKYVPNRPTLRLSVHQQQQPTAANSSSNFNSKSTKIESSLWSDLFFSSFVYVCLHRFIYIYLLDWL